MPRLPERRRFVRTEVPLKVIIKAETGDEPAKTTNISPIGLRLEAPHKIADSKTLDLLLYLPENDVPIQLNGKIVWQSKVSLEDKAPYDVGVEILVIEEKKKNIFLKYLCDLLYQSVYKERD